MIYLHIKFHMPNYNSSSVTAIKPNVKENLFYTLQKQYLKKRSYFSQSITTQDFRELWASGIHRSLLNSGIKEHKLLF
jgi:hypothetical protein